MTKHIPEYAGHTIAIDVFYPIGGSHPCILYIAALTRFADGMFLKDLSQENMITALTTTWAQWVGFPKRILCDAGLTCRGKLWDSLSSMYGIVIIPAPTEGHFQVGKAERQVQIVKKSSQAISDHLGGEASPTIRLALALLAHNLTPSSGTNLDPLTALTGRINTLSDVQWAPLSVADERGKTDQFSLRSRLESIGHAQAAILKFDANRSIRLCLKRNLQTTADEYLKPGDIADVWIPKRKRWQGVYRVLSCLV